ncbi:MAG: hypothetical protein AB7I59_24405 [Geminicoccaceae bacterium]
MLATIALAGCAHAPAVAPPVAALPARIGEPQLIRVEGTVEYRRYRVGPCQLDLFLRDTPGGGAMVAWLDARPAREVDPALGAACADLAARLRGRSMHMPFAQALSEPL